MDGRLGGWALVSGQIAEDDDVAFDVGWHQLGFDQEVRGQATMARFRNEGLGFPAPEPSFGIALLVLEASPTQACRLDGVCAYFVNENNPLLLVP